jgi:hypothetical protein
MLKGGNKKRQKPKAENVSVQDAAALLKYLDKHVSELDAVQRKLLAQGLTQVIARLKRGFEYE